MLSCWIHHPLHPPSTNSEVREYVLRLDPSSSSPSFRMGYPKSAISCGITVCACRTEAILPTGPMAGVPAAGVPVCPPAPHGLGPPTFPHRAHLGHPVLSTHYWQNGEGEGESIQTDARFEGGGHRRPRPAVTPRLGLGACGLVSAAL